MTMNNRQRDSGSALRAAVIQWGLGTAALLGPTSDETQFMLLLLHIAGWKFLQDIISRGQVIHIVPSDSITRQRIYSNFLITVVLNFHYHANLFCHGHNLPLYCTKIRHKTQLVVL